MEESERIAMLENPSPGIRKRKRIPLTKEQRQALEDAFQENNYVANKERRKALAARVGLTEEKIRKWFDNRRIKKRKYEGGTFYPGVADYDYKSGEQMSKSGSEREEQESVGRHTDKNSPLSDGTAGGPRSGGYARKHHGKHHTDQFHSHPSDLPSSRMGMSEEDDVGREEEQEEKERGVRTRNSVRSMTLEQPHPTHSPQHHPYHHHHHHHNTHPHHRSDEEVPVSGSAEDRVRGPSSIGVGGGAHPSAEEEEPCKSRYLAPAVPKTRPYESRDSCDFDNLGSDDPKKKKKSMDKHRLQSFLDWVKKRKAKKNDGVPDEEGYEAFEKEFMRLWAALRYDGEVSLFQGDGHLISANIEIVNFSFLLDDGDANRDGELHSGRDLLEEDEGEPVEVGLEVDGGLSREGSIIYDPQNSSLGPGDAPEDLGLNQEGDENDGGEVRHQEEEEERDESGDQEEGEEQELDLPPEREQLEEEEEEMNGDEQEPGDYTRSQEQLDEYHHHQQQEDEEEEEHFDEGEDRGNQNDMQEHAVAALAAAAVEASSEEGLFGSLHIPRQKRRFSIRFHHDSRVIGRMAIGTQVASETMVFEYNDPDQALGLEEPGSRPSIGIKAESRAPDPGASLEGYDKEYEHLNSYWAWGDLTQLAEFLGTTMKPTELLAFLFLCATTPYHFEVPYWFKVCMNRYMFVDETDTDYYSEPDEWI